MSNKAHEQFGQLRQMMQQPPSPALWTDLIEFMESHNPKVQEDVLLPYIKGHLKRWPDELRVWHKTWTKRFLKGQHVPAAGMATQLVISNRHLHQYDIKAISRHSNYIEPFKSLTIEQESHLTMSFLAQFLSLPMFEHLETLKLEMNEVDPSNQLALLSALDHKPITTLRNDYCIEFNEHSIRELISGQRWPNMNTLYLGKMDHEIHTLEDVAIHHTIEDFGIITCNLMPWWRWAKSRQWLGHIKRLRVGHYYTDGMAEHGRRMLAEIEIPQCEAFEFYAYGIEPDAVIEALLKNHSLKNLRQFHGCSFWHHQDALRALLDAPHLHDELKTYFKETYHL